ncbi:hypothetical protein ABZV93_22310 [Actinopolymorpha sp. NPDC004070]|uniref:hypothetical protein n=1 Tax=Actinopolymorpha sp. NPDC004070 TaxID=3154548 RepID=UPI0033A32691
MGVLWPGEARQNSLEGLDRPLLVWTVFVGFVGVGLAVAVGRPDVRAGALVVVIGTEVSQLLESPVRLGEKAVSLRHHRTVDLGQADVVSDLFMAPIIGTMIFLWHIWGALFQYSRTELMTHDSTRTVRSPHLLLKKPLDSRCEYPRHLHRRGHSL